MPSIEQHVEWIIDCIATMRQNKHCVIEATKLAENDWWQHIQEVGKRGLKKPTDSWYLGANVEGKPRVFMPYLGGFPNYCQYCDEVAADGYKGLSFA